MKRKIKIDASSLKESSCKLRFKRIVIDGLTEPRPYNDTQYGSAFHKFVSTMHETKGDAGIATEAASTLFKKPCEIRRGKEHLSEIHLLKTCYDFWEHFHKKDDFDVLMAGEKPLVEQNFELLIYENETTQVYLCGTIDKIGRFRNGCYAIGDYKTHSLFSVARGGNWEYGAAEYFKQYELSSQLLTYRCAIDIAAEQTPESIFGVINQTPVGVFIDGVFLSSKEPTRFKRSPVKIFKPEEIAYFRQQLVNKAMVIASLPLDYKDMDGIIHGACSENMFKCKYFQLCAAPDDIARGHLMRQNYITREYNPLEFGK